MIVTFVIACVVALFAPTLVHALCFASFHDATWFFRQGDVLAKEVACVYVGATLAIAVLGALYARGRRIHPLVLHLVAFAPFAFAVGGCVVRDRVRHWKLDVFGYGNGTEFVANVTKSEIVLDIAATMTAFAMGLVALAAVIRHVSRRDGAGTILVSSMSSAVFAAVALGAYGRFAVFDALGGVVIDAFASVPHALVVAKVTRILSVTLTVGAILAGVIASRRIRAPHGKSAFAFLLFEALVLAVPPAIAERDDARFHVRNPSALPDGIRAPSGTLPLDVPIGSDEQREPRVVVKADGTRLLFDPRDGKLTPMSDADLDHDPLGLIVDRAATFASLARAIPDESTKAPFWLRFYVEPAARPNVSSFGAVAEYVASTNTTTGVRWSSGTTTERSIVFLTYEPPSLRVWHESGPELVTQSTNDPAAIAARRLTLGTIRELADYPIYICVRPTDTLGDVWRIADDIRAVVGHPVNIRFTDQQRKDPVHEFENVW